MNHSILIYYKLNQRSNSHVDHIDGDVTNNVIGNLRPLCNSCNTSGTRVDEYKYRGRHAITYNGETMTPTEWARKDFVIVCGRTILQRLARGWDIEDALKRKPVTR